MSPLDPRASVAVLGTGAWGTIFTQEIIARQLTATVVACAEESRAAGIAALCHNEYFRPYVATDVPGGEIAGTTQKVIALASGPLRGWDWGSTRARPSSRAGWLR